jgi:hypothetical protein
MLINWLYERITSLRGTRCLAYRIDMSPNKFTRDFSNDFCKTNGEIDWDKLVRFNSAIQ